MPDESSVPSFPEAWFGPGRPIFRGAHKTRSPIGIDLMGECRTAISQPLTGPYPAAMILHAAQRPGFKMSEKRFAAEKLPNRGQTSRRQVLGALAATSALAGIGDRATAAMPTAAVTDASLTPDQALKEILDGNARFVDGAPIAHTRDLAIIRARAAEGQWPIVGVLSCADSRVPVEMVFDEPIGRLFVTRVAGNITTPEIIASLEYAVAVLGIKAIVVMGHSSCGAVKAAMDNPEVPGQISTLFPAILPAIYMTPSRDPMAVTRQNAVIHAATLINSSTVIEAKVNAGELKVVPAVYDVATSKVEVLPIPRALRQTSAK